MNASYSGASRPAYKTPASVFLVENHTFTDWAREQLTEPLRFTPVSCNSFHSSSLGHDLFGYIPSSCHPLLPKVDFLAAKDRLHITDDDTVILNLEPHTPYLRYADTALPPHTDPSPRIYASM